MAVATITQYLDALGNPITNSVAETPIQIKGTLFGATQGTGTVTFHGVTAAVTYWSDVVIVATVPIQATYPAVFPVVVTPSTGGAQAGTGPIFTTLAPKPGVIVDTAANRTRIATDVAAFAEQLLVQINAWSNLKNSYNVNQHYLMGSDPIKQSDLTDGVSHLTPLAIDDLVQNIGPYLEALPVVLLNRLHQASRIATI